VPKLVVDSFAENFHLVIHVHPPELSLGDALLQQVILHLQLGDLIAKTLVRTLVLRILI
jgi:hypothetical protein